MIWLIIALSGLGTYLMRSTGIWVAPRFVPHRWLAHLPLAVILVMTVGGIYSLGETPRGMVAAIAASAAVVLASLKKLPLVVCIAIGCIVFGALADS
ncbi:MAG TPA: AzlD domain-containing protein [Crinalium sp.]